MDALRTYSQPEAGFEFRPPSEVEPRFEHSAKKDDTMAWGNPNAPAPQPVAEDELSPAEWANKRELLLLQWDADKKALEIAKENEMASRKAVADFAFPVDTRLAGRTNNQELPNGYTLKLGDKLNHKIVALPKTIQEVEEKIIPTISNEAVFKFERIVKVTYDFSVGEYNKLEADNPADVKLKEQIDKLIEVSRGAPSLEIKPPKGS
jgi:hypothetical protein